MNDVFADLYNEAAEENALIDNLSVRVKLLGEGQPLTFSGKSNKIGADTPEGYAESLTASEKLTVSRASKFVNTEGNRKFTVIGKFGAKKFLSHEKPEMAEMPEKE